MTARSKPNLQKKEIVTSIKSVVGTSSKNIQKITDEMIEIIIYLLIDNKKLNVKNLGSFRIAHKSKRKGRNPKTKEEFTINSRNTIKFKVSNILKKKLREL